MAGEAERGSSIKPTPLLFPVKHGSKQVTLTQEKSNPAFSIVAKPTSLHTRAPGRLSETAVVAQVLGSLFRMQETQLVLLAPGFGLA